MFQVIWNLTNQTRPTLQTYFSLSVSLILKFVWTISKRNLWNPFKRSRMARSYFSETKKSRETHWATKDEGNLWCSLFLIMCSHCGNSQSPPRSRVQYFSIRYFLVKMSNASLVDITIWYYRNINEISDFRRIIRFCSVINTLFIILIFYYTVLFCPRINVYFVKYYMHSI